MGELAAAGLLDGDPRRGGKVHTTAVAKPAAAPKPAAKRARSAAPKATARPARRRAG
jgi:hypothetical protein